MGQATAPVEVRPMQVDEAVLASDLVVRVFTRFVAPSYSNEGVRAFLAYAGPQSLERRATRRGVVLVAWSGREMAGVIEIREGSKEVHIALLFVDAAWQGRGVARALVRQAIATSRARHPGVRRVTVNSSPNSVGAYRRLGFEATGPERAVAGIRFTPMIAPVGSSGVAFRGARVD